MLEALARGLRAAGGVLSPNVSQQLAQEGLQDQAAQKQMALMGMQRQFALEDQERARRLQEQSPQYQAQLEALNNERAFRQEVAGAGGDMTRIAGAAMKYGKPEIAMNVFKSAEDRQARLEQAREQLAFRERELTLRMDDRAATREQQQAAQQALLLLKQQGLALQGQIAQGSQQMRALQMQMAQESRDRASQDREDRSIESQVTKATTNLKDFGPALAAAQDLNKILSTYTPQNIPGVGYAKNTDIGKAFLSQSGKDASASIKQFGNTVLKAMSGAAVTAPEEIRQMAASMADGRFSAEDLYIAWPKMLDWMNSNVGIAAAGLSPKAREVFQSRSGVNLSPLAPKYVFDRQKGTLVENKGTASSVPPPPPGFKVD